MLRFITGNALKYNGIFSYIADILW